MTQFPEPVPLWRIDVAVPKSAVAAFETAMEGICVAVSSFGEDEGPWRVEGYTDREPDKSSLDAGLALAAKATGIAPPKVEIEFLTPRDWLSENLAGFTPIRVGRFFIYPSHYDGDIPPAAIPFCIDAGTAFGSGTHPTTETCLRALAKIAKTRTIGNALDLGCGSGILAFAIAKLWPASVLAVDIDPEAVEVTRRNARDNELRGRIRARLSTGYQSDAVRGAAPYDLIVANVLARPLIAMAGDTWRALAPGGHLVLSGLLARDAAWVAARHRAFGLRRIDTMIRNDWATLTFKRPHRP